MNKKLISIILIFIFLVSALPVALASDDDKYYTIDLADFFIKVDENGLLKINESLEYTFHGQYNGVYRDIPLKEGQSIENLNVTADGAYTKVETMSEDNGDYRIKVYLYANPELTQKIRDTSVEIHYSYDLTNAVNIYNDVGELHFKFWGDNWDVRAQKVMAHIELPQDKHIQYWINPYYAQTTESWNGNTLNIETDGKVDSYLEFRGLIPLSEFKNPIYANKINQNGHDKIVKIQEDYENNAKTQDTLVSCIPLIFLASLIVPVAAYFRYGREPKVPYDSTYEHDVPTDDSPMFVDAMFSTKRDIGKLSNKGIQATIMEMINDKVIKIANKEEQSKNMKLQLPAGDIGYLPEYKQNIINLLLRPYARDNILDFNEMKRDLRVEYLAKRFNQNLKDIERSYEVMEVKPVLRQYFHTKGANYFTGYSIILAIASIIVAVYGYLSQGPSAFYLMICGIIFLIAAVIIFALPNTIGGRWTEEGYTRFKEWQAFKKFLNDFSLIKQHPPESIEIWNRYLVYATALGSAKAVSKAMKTIAPAHELGYSDVYYYNYYGGPLMFSSIVSTSRTSAHSDNSGFGGAGGGSGGGGGGAF